MIESDAVVLFLQEKAERPLRAKDIARALKVQPREYAAFKRLLRDLEEQGRVYRARKGRYAAPGRINLAVGTLQVTRSGKGFVVPDNEEGDVFIPASQLGNAYDGDRVVARIERRKRGWNPEGSIVKILERARSQVVGAYRRAGKYGTLAPSEQTLHRDVFIPSGAEAGARDGDVVVARIVEWGSDHQDPVGEVTVVLGRPGEPGVDVLAIVHAHELPTEFPPDVLAEAEEIAFASRGLQGLEERVDLRDWLTFTIDPADAKDHDDAISIQRLDDERFKVGVHIADVSHFVTERSPIDLEAFRRATSVYLVDRVLPMLPEILSSDLCSLKAGEDRHTLSVLLEMDSAGGVMSTEFASTVIQSRNALTYEHAQEIIDGSRSADDEIRDALRHLRDLAVQLRRRRQERGGLDFDLPEARVIVNAAGEPTDIQRMMRLETHRLIEEFMILANESVARIARKKKLPFIYRVHEPPDRDRLERLREFVAGFGLSLAKDSHRSPRSLQRLLAAVEGRPEESVVTTLALRIMKQARYGAECKEHFGLGSRAYTHFTSPIRRYPDLAIHRIVRRALIEKRPVPESVSVQMRDVALRSSTREREAMQAERDSVELKKIEYMERHLGDHFHGTISGVTSYGVFVLMDDVLAEGLIHVSQLTDDYYHFVEAEHALVGELRKRRFRLGDRVEVQVVSVDREARELDLGLVERDPVKPN
jgi:ribonuclease R